MEKNEENDVVRMAVFLPLSGWRHHHHHHHGMTTVCSTFCRCHAIIIIITIIIIIIIINVGNCSAAHPGEFQTSW
jgi:hypothetical protein